MKSPCRSLLIGVFPVFDRGFWQKFSYASNSRWHKLKRDQIRPRGSSQTKLILGYPPLKNYKLYDAKHAKSCKFGKQC